MNLGKKKTGVFKFSDFVAEKTELDNLANKQIDWDGLFIDVAKELEDEYSQDLNELEFNKNILGDLISEGKNIQRKIADELKKNNQIENKHQLFNTKVYKLNDETINNSSRELTQDEIRKARLSKLSKLD